MAPSWVGIKEDDNTHGGKVLVQGEADGQS